MSRIRVGVLGATGVAGQRYLELLADHPWFEVAYLAASPRSAGKPYAAAVAGRWHGAGEIPPGLGDLPVHDVADVEAAAGACGLVFSATSTEVARDQEMRHAAAGLKVVSNASAHRRDPDVPVIIPEVNPEHLDVLDVQRERRGLGEGFVVAKPNCSLQSYLTPLFALHRKFGLASAIVSTLQALSGAGYPGVPSGDLVDNVIPLIRGEEEKTEQEPRKILGAVGDAGIEPEEGIVLSAHCNRVPVQDGHLACVSFSLVSPATADEIRELWAGFRGEPQERGLPSAPDPAIVVRDEPDRPQPRRDRDAGRGMAVSVGRLRPCPVLDHRFVGLSHNTLRGAAGGGVLIAELLRERGLL